MRTISRKRARLNLDRRQAEDELFGLAPYCARCGRADVELHGHELVNRGRGGSPARPDMLMCNACNVWIEDNPEAATEQGWKLPAASLRHRFTGPDFYCLACALPRLNWRHR